MGVALLLLLVVFNFIGIDEPAPYFIVALIIWFAFLHSGVHATLAGVLVAFTIPAKAKLQSLDFVGWTREKLAEIEEADIPGAAAAVAEKQQELNNYLI